jgi:hypothetical protein
MANLVMARDYATMHGEWDFLISIIVERYELLPSYSR